VKNRDIGKKRIFILSREKIDIRFALRSGGCIIPDRTADAHLAHILDTICLKDVPKVGADVHPDVTADI
jgi:hypothetical protein